MRKAFLEAEEKELINYVEVGDYVERDEEIATIETDKVSNFCGHRLETG